MSVCCRVSIQVRIAAGDRRPSHPRSLDQTDRRSGALRRPRLDRIGRIQTLTLPDEPGHTPPPFAEINPNAPTHPSPRHTTHVLLRARSDHSQAWSAAQEQQQQQQQQQQAPAHPRPPPHPPRPPRRAPWPSRRRRGWAPPRPRRCGWPRATSRTCATSGGCVRPSACVRPRGTASRRAKNLNTNPTLPPPFQAKGLPQVRQFLSYFSILHAVLPRSPRRYTRDFYRQVSEERNSCFVLTN